MSPQVSSGFPDNGATLHAVRGWYAQHSRPKAKWSEITL